jgi:uncharacterized integral membrane protein
MIFILFISALLLIFVGQNIDVVDVRFLLWSISMSRAVLILFILLLGFTFGWFIHSYYTYQKSKNKI